MWNFLQTKIGGVEYRGRIERAVLDAEKALAMPYKDRLKIYSFVVRYNGPIRRPAEVDDNDSMLLTISSFPFSNYFLVTCFLLARNKKNLLAELGVLIIQADV